MASFAKLSPLALAVLFACLGHAFAKDVPINWVAGSSPANISACVGDVLVFNFKSGSASVVQVKTGACTALAIKGYGSAGPVKVPVTAAGALYFKSGLGTQCAVKKMLLNVKVTTCSSTPSTIVVKNAAGLGWTTGAPYSTINAKCGDTLVFSWGGYENHDVVALPKANYDACSFGTSTQLYSRTFGGKYSLTLTKAGTTYYSCSVGQHCAMLQKVTVVTTC